MLNQTGFMLLPSADNTCSHCHTLLPAHCICYHGNCDGFSCCLDSSRVLHHLICSDKDTDTSERQKGTLSFGKDEACISWPSDLSLYTRAQQNRDLIDPEPSCKSSFIFYFAMYTHLYTHQMTGLDLFSTLLLFLQGHACPVHVV